MKVEQIYTGCLAEAAYYVESNGECAIIDPLRETAPYLKKAAGNGAKIKYIFETHFHADFVSGHAELAQKTGATIVYGPGAICNFDCYIAKDAEEFKIGNITIRVLHTPGHTPESSTFLLLDEVGTAYCIFTGDTLFIGDVGRPDLAGMLYDSLHSKIMPLPDDIIVYPAHGAGSACGKHMSKETYDTLGHQKSTNYALQPMKRQQFIKEVTAGLLPVPQYFAKNALLNKSGAGSLDNVYQQGLKGLSPDAFEIVAGSADALILDTRDAQVFSQGFVPGSINIGLSGQFAPWVGALITDIKQPILIVCDEGKEEETVMRLARVGYDNTLGYLEGGIPAWKKVGKETDIIHSLTAANFTRNFSDKVRVIDVRKPSEFEQGHVLNAENKPLDFINDWMSELHHKGTYYLHCAGGYRSMVTASILKSRGFNNIIDIAGGYSALVKAGIEQSHLITEAK
jgi:glyoxylase-like metal-dependent hydrolase (beta-lactamase superfamily II)/rhodanese-related sulfurtransferase